MKFLYIGDLHLSDNPPSSRIDNYHDSVIKKIQEIKNIALNNQCTAILEGGDFLNNPKLSEEKIADYLSCFNDKNINDIIIEAKNKNIDYEELIENLEYNTCPLIGVVGNHELFGETMQSFSKTTLYFLNKMGFINLVTKENPIIFKDKDGFSVAISGSNYSYEIDSKENREDYIVNEKLADYQIHIVHGMLLEKPNKMYKSYTLISDIIDKTSADITLCGHYHDGFKTVKKDGKIIANSGSIIRQSNKKSNYTKKPRVLLIEITKDKGISCKSIYLKNVLPAEKIFDMEEKETKKRFNEKLEEIKQKVESYNVEKGNNIQEIVKNIAENKHLNEDLKNETVLMLSDKMKDMNVEIKELPKYTIKKLILENFQSHEYSEFDFSDGLNVFTGESGSGKTSVIRALDWIYENSMKNARKYIRANKDYCKATVILSNGYEISRIIEKSAKGFNGYEIYYPDTQERKRTNTKELPVVQELLGFSNLIIDNSRASKDIPINFLKQGSPWFFVGDGNTSPERAKIIGSIYGTQYVDSLSKDLEQELRKNNTLIKEAETTCQNFDEQLRCISFIDEMAENLKKSDELIEKIQKAQEKKRQIVELFGKYKLNVDKIKALEYFLDETKDIEVNFNQKYDKIINEKNKKDKAINLILKYQKNMKRFNYLSSFVKDINNINLDDKKINIEKAIRLNEQRDEIMKKVLRAQKLENDLKFYQAKEKFLEQFIKDTENYNDILKVIDRIIELDLKKKRILEATQSALADKEKMKALIYIVKQIDTAIAKKDAIETIQNNLQKKKQIVSLKDKGHIEQEKIKKLYDDVNKLNKEISAGKEKYAEILKEAGHCPVCANKIEVDNIPNIIKANFSD